MWHSNANDEHFLQNSKKKKEKKALIPLEMPQSDVPSCKVMGLKTFLDHWSELLFLTWPHTDTPSTLFTVHLSVHKLTMISWVYFSTVSIFTSENTDFIHADPHKQVVFYNSLTRLVNNSPIHMTPAKVMTRSYLLRRLCQYPRGLSDIHLRMTSITNRMVRNMDTYTIPVAKLLLFSLGGSHYRRKDLYGITTDKS